MFGFAFQNPVLLPWRTVKENVGLPLEILGDKSSDSPDRVTALLQLMDVKDFADSYITKTPRRKPIVPSHTRKVDDCTKGHATDYRLPQFLKRSDVNLIVKPGVFSPLHGNSTKFTAWVIERIIQPDQTVLEIGAGTGALSLVAWSKLRELGSKQVVVDAVECVDVAYENLRENCDSKSGIKPYRGIMVPDVENGQEKGFVDSFIRDWKRDDCITDAALIKLSDTNKLVIVSGPSEYSAYGQRSGTKRIYYAPLHLLSSYDMVIADLPFVDARPRDAYLWRGFLDEDHREHLALFKGIAKGRWLKVSGCLITSFSTLGGSADVDKFEGMVHDSGLYIGARFSFSEANYFWMVRGGPVRLDRISGLISDELRW